MSVLAGTNGPCCLPLVPANHCLHLVPAVLPESMVAMQELCPASTSAEGAAVTYLCSVYGAANAYEREHPKVTLPTRGSTPR